MQKAMLNEVLLGGEVLEAFSADIRPEMQMEGVFVPLQIVPSGEDLVTLLKGTSICHNYRNLMVESHLSV